MSSLELAHILREKADPAIILTDNKSVTRFSPPPPLFNACDCLLQVNFELAHIAVSISKAAQFPSGLELKITGTSDPRSGKNYKRSQKGFECLPWM